MSEVQRFITALFEPSDCILVRPIETWTEGDRKRSRVDYGSVTHVLPILLLQQWPMLLSASKKKSTNLFYGVCPRFKVSEKSTYDLAWQIRKVSCLWADLDDCTRDQALERCKAAGLPHPSIIVASGHGVHLYWLLDKPYLIDDVPDPPAVKNEWVVLDGKRKPIPFYQNGSEKVHLADRKTGKKIPGNSPGLSEKAQFVQDVIAGIASKIGGDHTQELSRLLRIPGSLNRKNGRNGQEPIPCRLVFIDETLRYSFDDFRHYADESPEKQRREKIAKVRLPANLPTLARHHDWPSVENLSGNVLIYSRVLRFCGLSHCIASAPSPKPSKKSESGTYM